MIIILLCFVTYWQEQQAYNAEDLDENLEVMVHPEDARSLQLEQLEADWQKEQHEDSHDLPSTTD